MSASQINHFLVIYDIPAAAADVQSFDEDYGAAVAAYGEAEHEHRDSSDIEVVLLGSDSIETLKRTHSSYFELSERHADQIVGAELAYLGLS